METKPSINELRALAREARDALADFSNAVQRSGLDYAESSGISGSAALLAAEIIVAHVEERLEVMADTGE